MNSLTIPNHQMESFAKLPDPVKDEVYRWLRVLRAVDETINKSDAINAEAERMGHVKGFSAINIRRKYYMVKKSGWEVLINHSKNKDKKCGLNYEFVEWWKGLQMQYQRNSKGAYREVLRRYRRGEKIPGYGTWADVWQKKFGSLPPAECPADPPLPQGWSSRNMMRYCPTAFEFTAARIGRGAAAMYRPLVYSTRVGMLPGQIYVFDDVWHDNKVNFLGVNTKAMRPLEFSCVDVFSGCQIAWGAQPMLENLTTGKRETLKETEMRFLLAHVLCNIGYLKSGTILHVERGTATIRPDLEQQLSDWTNKAVTVARGAMSGKAASDGFFLGRPKGSSRFKAILESHHNLKHNELAALPGQVGKDRDHSPEELHGRDQYNSMLIQAAEKLPEDRAKLLIFPFLSFYEWKSIVKEIYNNINYRTNHDLEGWEAAGNITTQYRLSLESPWMGRENFLQLPPQQRELIEKIINQPGLIRVRKLSPQEVWNKGRLDLIKLPAHYVPMILGRNAAKIIRLGKDHLFAFRDRRMGPDIMRYAATIRTPDDTQLILEPNKQYMIHATPFDTSGIFVSDMDGRYLGAARRWETVSKMDTEALHKQMGKAMAEEQRLLRPVQARLIDQAKAKLEMHQHNKKVLNGEPITIEDLTTEIKVQESEFESSDMEAALSKDETKREEDWDYENISNVLRND